MVMSKMQAKALGLLSEFVQLCESRDVPCCISGKIAWDCALNNGFSDDAFQLNVLVPSSHFAALKEGLMAESPAQNRVATEVAVGKGKPEAFRYVAKDSLVLLLTQSGNPAPGLAVFVSEVQADGNAWKFMLSPRKMASISFDPFSEQTMGYFEGRSLRLPARPGDFFRETIGAGWKTKCTFPASSQSLTCVASASLPYEVFLDAVRESSVDLDSVIADSQSYAKWRRTGFREFVPEMKAQVRLYDTLAQRFRICEELLPHKAELLQAWEAGRKDNVVKALGDYLTRLKDFYEFGLTLYFDEELFDLALKALKYQGFAHADELPGLVPARHREVLISDLIAPYVLNED